VNRKDLKPDFESIPTTLLGILYARALETETGGLLRDPKSVEMVQRIDYDFRKLDDRELAELSRFAVVVRTEILDEAVFAFMNRYPHGAFVNLGAGLDTRFDRLDNGLIRWIDLDLPEVVELRRRFFSEGERCRMIGCSVMDLRWMDEVPSRNGEQTLFIAEGLLMYFPADRVRELLLALLARFPEAELLLEANSTKVVEAQREMGNPELAGDGAVPEWGLDDIAVVEGWHPQIRCIKEYPLMHRYEYLWRSLLPEHLRDTPLTKDHSNTIYHLKFVPSSGVDSRRRGFSERAVPEANGGNGDPRRP
jgi:O-methyltransferase involved in polyketide biosynthesis